MGICFGKSPRQSDSTKVPIPKPNQPYPNPHEELVIHPTKPIQQKNPYYPNAGQYVALYDYKARLDGDLTFTRGDRMVILNNSQGDWWEAQSLANNKTGLNLNVGENTPPLDIKGEVFSR